MSASLSLWLLLAISIFWTVGVYNRLMRLRARGQDAFGSADKCITLLIETACKGLGVADVAAAKEALQSDVDFAPGWTALVDSLVSVDEALRKARLQPLEPAGMKALADEVDALQSEWQRINDMPLDLAGPAAPEDMREKWNSIAEKFKSSRNGLNQILDAYDEAINQFPARLLAGTMGFAPAGRL